MSKHVVQWTQKVATHALGTADDLSIEGPPGDGWRLYSILFQCYGVMNDGAALAASQSWGPINCVCWPGGASVFRLPSNREVVLPEDMVFGTEWHTLLVDPPGQAGLAFAAADVVTDVFATWIRI